jgi:hypothetical protein
MPRCRKILATGKRCKAHAIAGSKFCLFHTPGQKMKRRKRQVSMNTPEKSKTRLRRMAENQAAARGGKWLGTYLAYKGTQYRHRPDYLVITTHHAARYNAQGTVMVGAHTQKTIEPTKARNQAGVGFQQTENPKRKRKISSTMIRGGRIIPILGYTFVGYNMYGAYKQRGVGGVAEQTAIDWHAATLSNDLAELVLGAYGVYRFGNRAAAVASSSANVVGPGF